MAVTASLVVSFGSDADIGAVLVAEVDNRSLTEGGYNNGKTQFLPGDAVHYLLYQHLIASTTHRSSAGSINRVGSGQRQIEETVSFLDTVEASVRFPVYTLDSVEWLGNDLGAMSAPGGQALRCSVSGVGVAIVKYTAKFEVYRLNSPSGINGRDSFDIAILVVGTEG